MLPLEATGQAAMAALSPSYYPPQRTGLRGSHPGSNDHAHSMAWAGQSDWGPTTKLAETYDLVVVGAGISGLTSAYAFRKQYPGTRVLILDNHDDFGGHAKRNEHTVDGRQLLTYGGSQTLVEPHNAGPEIKTLFEGIGIDLKLLGHLPGKIIICGDAGN